MSSPRLIYYGADAPRWKAYATARHRLLEGVRKSQGAYIKHQFITVEGATILLCACENPSAHRVIITAGGFPHILLTDYLHAEAYNYYQDRLSPAKIAVGASQSFPLSPLFNGRSQLGDHTEMTIAGGWSSSIIGNNYAFLEGLNDYEMGVFHAGNEIYGRIGDTIGHIATVPDTFLQDYAKPYGGLFGLPAYKQVPAWNLYRGVILYSLVPSTQQVLDSWYWIPSFFSVAPADENGLFAGWYYGQYPTPTYDFNAPLTSLKVSFKGLMNTRYSGGAYQYGWAELVTEVNGVTKGDLNFFFQATPLPVPDNPIYAHYTTSGITSNATITVGSDREGFESQLGLTVVGSPDVDMWNLNAWNAAFGAVGIAVTDGVSAKFYRYSEYNTLVYETEYYHSHSISRDGTLLAVFESANGNFITDVQVFDLFGTREPVEGSEYTAGGFTQLRLDGAVVAVEALTGCVIPYRAEDFEPASLPYDLATAQPTGIVPDDYTLELPALATLQFNKIAAAGGVVQKVVCTNGVDAEFSVTQDPCADNTYILEDPDLGVTEEKLVGWFNFNVGAKGVVRGDFSGSGTAITFAGVGDGLLVERPDTFDLTYDSMGRVFPVSPYDYIGDLIAGSCVVDVDGTFYLDFENCGDSCGETPVDFDFAMTTTCGQTGSGTFDADGLEPLDVYMSDGEDIQVGDDAIVTGGLGPYEYSFTGGTISDDGEILTINSCGAAGTPRWATVTVTDSCDNTATVDVRLPGGSWVTVTNSADCYCGTSSSGIGTACTTLNENSIGPYTEASVIAWGLMPDGEGGFRSFPQIFSYFYLGTWACSSSICVGRPRYAIPDAQSCKYDMGSVQQEWVC